MNSTEEEREDDLILICMTCLVDAQQMLMTRLCSYYPFAHRIHSVCRVADRIFNENPACINEQDAFGKSPLIMATMYFGDYRTQTQDQRTKQTELVLWFLHHNANVNVITRDYWSPLCCAIWTFNIPLAELLVLHGAIAHNYVFMRRLGHCESYFDNIRHIEAFYARVQQRISACRRCAAALLSAPVLARTRIPRDVMLMIVKHMWAQRRFREEWEQKK